MNTPATDFLSGVELGTRIVVRQRQEDGFTDALGILHSRTPHHCVIDTKRGLVTVALADVVAAKKVPPPPPPRSPRRPSE
jgi:hypothetical protein